MRPIPSLLLLLVPTLAGCTGGAVIPDAPAEAGLPDLHATLLDVTVPAGPASFAAVLDIEPSHWIPVTYGVYDPATGTPVVIPGKTWTLCVLVQPQGLGAGNVARVALFEMADQPDGTTRLIPAAGGFAVAAEGEDPRCALPAQGLDPLPAGVANPSPAAFQSDAPRALRLAVVVATQWGGIEPIQAGRVLLGIGSRVCETGASSYLTYCGPGATTVAEPRVRGGAARSAFASEPAFCSGHSYDPAGAGTCQGFTVTDRIEPTGPARVGLAHLARTVREPAIIYLDALTSGAWVPGGPVGALEAEGARHHLAVSVGMPEGDVELGCGQVQAGRSTIWERVLASSAGPARVVVEWQVVGVGGVSASLLEVHLDLEALGWSLEPVVRLTTDDRGCLS